MSVHACYLLALGLFAVVVGGKYLLSIRGTGLEPPALPAGKVPTWLYQPADLLGVALFFFGFYAMAVIGAAETGDGNGGNRVYTVADLAVGIMIQFVAPIAAFAMISGRSNPVQWLGLAWKDWPKVLGIAPLAVFGMFAFSVGLYTTAYGDMITHLGLAEEQEVVTLFREGQDPVLLIAMAFMAVIVAPLCEEVVFRGYIYPVAKKYAGSWTAAIFSALIFSAAHGSVAAMVPLFVFGLLMVAIYEFTGSLWAPIAVHFLFNGSTVAIQILARFADLPEVVSR